MEIKSYIATSDQGPYLNINEDKIDVNLKDNLFMILDGFGGAGIGDIAVSKIVDDVNNFYTKIGDDPEATLPFYYNKKFLLEGNALINAVHVAHKNLVKHNFSREMGERAGASGIFLSHAEKLVTMVMTGSCKSFFLRNGELNTLSIPDSFEMISGEKKNATFPLSALGLFDDLSFSTREFAPREDDLLIMMTEGSYWELSNLEIKKILSNSKISLSDKVKMLLSLANDRGNQRNQSTLLLQY